MIDLVGDGAVGLIDGVHVPIRLSRLTFGVLHSYQVNRIRRRRTLLRCLFENHVLDTDRRELRRGAAIVPVTPQVFDLLTILIRNRDRVVSKDDLVAAIWHGRAITDTALTTRINAARTAIGDSGLSQRLITTVTRKGYRFIGSVQEDGDGTDAASTTRPGDVPISTAARSEHPSVAVLPFATPFPANGPDARAEIIAEDVVVELAKHRWLDVIPRLSHFPGRDVRQTGTETGARYILHGRVRGGGNRVRITAMLIETASSALVLAGNYDKAPAAGYGDELAAALAADVVAAITTAERHRAMRGSPDRLGAWESYQRGMWHMSNCDPAEHALAESLFRRAIEIDPVFPGGYSALGWSRMMAASIFSQMSIAEGCALAEPLLRRATALDDGDVDARARLAIASLLQGDLETAFEDAQRALAVDPNCAEALGVKGTALLYGGRRQQGRAAIEQHLRRSPRDPARPIRLCQIAASHYLDGNHAEALTIARRVVRQYPKHPTAFRWLAASLGQLGRSAEAEAALHELQTIAPSSFDMYVRQRPRYCDIEHAPLIEGLRKAGWRE